MRETLDEALNGALKIKQELTDAKQGI
jgi:hypothetical protein